MTEVKIQDNTEIAKKHRILAAAILVFIGKIIITWQPPWVIWKFFVLM